MPNVTTNDIITEDSLRRVVEEHVEEDLVWRQMYRDLDISGIDNDTVKIPEETDNMGMPERIGEGAEFPRDKEDITTTTVTVDKYGFEVSVSMESEAFSVFDIVARQVDKQARKMDEKLNELAFKELESNLHPNSPVGPNDGSGLNFGAVVDGQTELREDKYDPDTLIVNVFAHRDLVKSPEFQRASDLGDETVLEGSVGRVAGMDVLISNGGYLNDGNKNGYGILADRNEYGYEVIQNGISTDSYEDPSRQATIYQIWTYRAYESMEPEAAIKLAG